MKRKVVVLLIWAALISCLAGLWRAGSSCKHEHECDHNIQEIARAMEYYREFYGSYPAPLTTGPDGTAAQSWRRMILPLTDYAVDLSGYDTKQKWNAPTNLKLTSLGLRVFQCPDDRSNVNNFTSYFMIEDLSSNADYAIIEIHGLSVPWGEPKDVRVADIEPMLKSDRASLYFPRNCGFAVAGPGGRIVRIRSADWDGFRKRRMRGGKGDRGEWH